MAHILDAESAPQARSITRMNVPLDGSTTLLDGKERARALRDSTSSSDRSTAGARVSFCLMQEQENRLTRDVGLDLVLEDALWERLNTPLQQPADQDDCSVNTVLLTDSEHCRVLSQVGTANTTERGERLRLDFVLLHPCHKLELRVLDGELDLVWGHQHRVGASGWHTHLRRVGI